MDGFLILFPLDLMDAPPGVDGFSWEATVLQRCLRKISLKKLGCQSPSSSQSFMKKRKQQKKKKWHGKHQSFTMQPLDTAKVHPRKFTWNP